MCGACQHGSHRQHHHSPLDRAAASERLRLKAVGLQTRALTSALKARIDALNVSSQNCINSAYVIKQDIKRQFDGIRAALLEREQQLTSAVDQVTKVRSSMFTHI